MAEVGRIRTSVADRRRWYITPGGQARLVEVIATRRGYSRIRSTAPHDDEEPFWVPTSKLRTEVPRANP